MEDSSAGRPAAPRTGRGMGLQAGDRTMVETLCTRLRANIDEQFVAQAQAVVATRQFCSQRRTEARGESKKRYTTLRWRVAMADLD